jgi:hypothetical protein
MANDFDVEDFFSKKWIKFQDMYFIVFLHDIAFFVLAQTAFFISNNSKTTKNETYASFSSLNDSNSSNLNESYLSHQLTSYHSVGQFINCLKTEKIAIVLAVLYELYCIGLIILMTFSFVSHMHSISLKTNIKYRLSQTQTKAQKACHLLIYTCRLIYYILHYILVILINILVSILTVILTAASCGLFLFCICFNPFGIIWDHVENSLRLNLNHLNKRYLKWFKLSLKLVLFIYAIVINLCVLILLKDECVTERVLLSICTFMALSRFGFSLFYFLRFDCYFPRKELKEAVKKSKYSEDIGISEEIETKIKLDPKVSRFMRFEEMSTDICLKWGSCEIMNLEHALKCHSYLRERPKNATHLIGFHQTDKEAAFQIALNDFKPGKRGMFGGGIYFARTTNVTRCKLILIVICINRGTDSTFFTYLLGIINSTINFKKRPAKLISQFSLCFIVRILWSMYK